jgi:zona occludens toxin
MIYAYTGLPGSGKSYSVVANQVLPALKDGRVVVTNVPLYEERIREHVTTGQIRELPLDLIAQDPDRIDEYAPAGCVLVIDELWKLFPAGQKVDRVAPAFKRLLAEHRHMVDSEGRSTQIVFVTQDLAQIGAFARQLVEQTFLHKKLGHLGMSGSYSCTVYRGPQTGQNPPQNAEIRTMHGRYEERVYRLYKSHTMSQSSGEGANEKSVDRRAVIWKRPIFAVILVAAVAFVAFGPRLLKSFFHSGSAAPAASGASGATAARPDSRLVRGSSSGPQPNSVRWRVSGFLDAGEHSVALLASSDGQTAWVETEACQRTRLVAQCKYRGEWIAYDFPPRVALPIAPAESVTQPAR